MLMRALAEQWWPATILLFMPRWAFLFPLPVLAYTARRSRRPALWAVQGATALLVLGPLMGLALPFGSLFHSTPQGPHVRVLSLNRGMGELDYEGLRRLIERERPDVFCLQEPHHDPRLLDLFSRDWHWNRAETIATRHHIVGDIPTPVGDPGQYRLEPVRVWRTEVRLPDGHHCIVASVHMPTIRPGFVLLGQGNVGGLKRSIEWRWSQTRTVGDLLSASPGLPVVAAGDFNMPSDSPMMGVLKKRFSVGFDQAGWGYGYTRPTMVPWVGIDHVLATREWTFTDYRVGPNVGSDHLPVIAETVLSVPRRTPR
jgi:endonuclease/exonuclease/phosphatase (EEP) superfamily protein YafD